MAANSLANIYQAVLISQLVNLLADNLATTDKTELLWSAMGLLGIIGVLYLMRETFNVLRRYMVENTCTG